jgi:zinc-binding alcohol dehydrogenase family protein
MKAISFRQQLPIENPDSLLDVTIDPPRPGPRDLLVEVRAISVNPVDTKIRKGSGPGQPSGELKILGWDAAGVVAQVGVEVSLFRPGDEVYYAGSVDRPGCYAELQAVDERLVGRKPASLDFANAAALPLTTITAWEMLFDRLAIPISPSSAGTLLIIGAAGGVGFIAIQLAKKLTGLNVIATASRPETVEWCRKMGADEVIDHRQPIAAQVRKLVPGGANYVLALTKTEDHYEEMIEAMALEASVALIENLARPVDINKLKPKSLSLHWEFMFARSRPQSPKMGEQGRLLNRVADQVDAGQIRTTATTHLGPINAANLQQAHGLLESGKAIGKIVLAGF